MPDQPIKPRPAIYSQLDPEATPGEALAARDVVAAFMDKSGLGYKATVLEAGQRPYVQVATDQPVMESHGLPEAIGRVAVTYRTPSLESDKSRQAPQP
jgi:hypothetical protein